MFVAPSYLFGPLQVIQGDRWEYGPLELVFLDNITLKGRKGTSAMNAIPTWNMTSRGGFVRPALKEVLEFVPALVRSRNPNVIIAPRQQGYTELHTMIASVVPTPILMKYGIKKDKANFMLWPPTIANGLSNPGGYAKAAVQAFEHHIWDRLAPRKRLSPRFFASDSSLRLLAGDSHFWMHRLYRLGMEYCEHLEYAPEDPKWKASENDVREAFSQIPQTMPGSYQLTRAHKGGHLWNPEDQQMCDEIVNQVVRGSETLESLDPVIELLHAERTHEDFAKQWSPVKEDFERSFYSKRAKVKVSFLETVDNCPAWVANEPLGNRDVLFRDILSFFNRKERHLILAVRSGKTVSEIAQDLGLAGHATISRKLKSIKRRLKKLLSEQS